MNETDRAFMERISSIATHDIMNGLATIGESTGLVRDLVALGAIGPGGKASGIKRGVLTRLLDRRAAPAPDKAMVSLQRSLDRCSQGVDRIGETTRALNRFLHGVTANEDPVPGETVAWVAAVLLGPVARKRRRGIIVGEPFPDFGLAGFPLLALYQPLIEAAECALCAVYGPAEGDTSETVRLHGAVRDGRAVFIVSTNPVPPPPASLFAADPASDADVSPRIRLLHHEAIFTTAV